MKKIGLISDTHGYLDEAVFAHFKNGDEIWNAGNFGSVELAQQFALQYGLTASGLTILNEIEYSAYAE